MNWLTDKSRRIAFGVPFKNGYTSVKKVLNGQRGAIRIPPNHMKKFPRKVFIVRHPMDRFLSLWRNKCRDHGSGAAVEGLTQEQLFERIQTGQTDDHWTPQVEMLGQYRKDATLLKLESVPAWWWENMQAEFPKENATDNYDEISPELWEQVMDHYADDLELYNEAL